MWITRIIDAVGAWLLADGNHWYWVSRGLKYGGLILVGALIVDAGR